MSHSTAEIMDDTGLQFFNLVDRNAVGCWNSQLPYAPVNHAEIARHDEALIFPADVKVSYATVMHLRASPPITSSWHINRVTHFAPFNALVKRQMLVNAGQKETHPGI